LAERELRPAVIARKLSCVTARALGLRRGRASRRWRAPAPGGLWTLRTSSGQPSSSTLLLFPQGGAKHIRKDRSQRGGPGGFLSTGKARGDPSGIEG